MSANGFLTVLILVYSKEISITSPTRLSSSVVLILSPILNGRDDKSSIPAIALLIVFLDENPIIVPAATLIAPAATPLTDENWNIIIIIVITMRAIFVIELIPFSSLLSRPREPAIFS